MTEQPLTDRLQHSLEPVPMIEVSAVSTLRLINPRWPLLIAGPIAVLLVWSPYFPLGSSLGSMPPVGTLVLLFAPMIGHTLAGIVLPCFARPDRRVRLAGVLSALLVAAIAAEGVAVFLASPTLQQSGVPIYAIHMGCRQMQVSLGTALALWLAFSCWMARRHSVPSPTTDRSRSSDASAAGV